MSASHWTAWIITALLSLGAVWYLYRRREPAGKGRTLLALLRWAALVLLLLLLFDPRIRQPLDRTAARNAPVLLDASISMLLPQGTSSTTRWQAATAEAAKRAGGAPITVFGDAPRTIASDSLKSTQPHATHSRLLPALQAAAEAGANSVTVITDGDLEDVDAITRWLPRLGMRVDWVNANTPSHNMTLSELSAPAWAEAGKSVPVAVGLQVASADGGDSAHVVLRQDGVVIGARTIVLPAVGRIANAVIDARPRAPAGGGHVRIEASIDGDDGFADDNTRNVYVYVSDEPAGVVLISLAPDWEPRFLLPVLERASGLPTRGYLRGGDGAWVRLGAGLDAGKRVTDAAVQSAAARADLLVIHNAGAESPTWLRTAMTGAARLLVLPPADASGIVLPAALGTAAADDWFVAADVPASPVASLMTGLQVADVPPLEAVHLLNSVPDGAWTPLIATRGRRGRPAPLAIAGGDASHRWAVALGAGYWRWAFRGDAAADVYTRLWSSLGAWLTRDAKGADVDAVRPVERSVSRGEAVQWVSRGGAMDSVRVRVTRVGAAGAAGGNGAAVESVVAASRDTAALQGLPSGTYRYNATSYAGTVSVSASGELTVESYSPEFARSTSRLESGASAAKALSEITRSRDTKPLHASWIPYVLLLLLLATEWILRRRWGLR